MSSDLNRTMIIGRLTKDAELKYTPSGTSVCSFSIANNRTYVSGGEKKNEVSYFTCVAWAKLGEVIANYCKKGQRIGVEGRLQQRSWDDQDGKKKYVVEIVVDNFQFLEAKKDGTTKSEPSAALEPDGTFEDESIPF